MPEALNFVYSHPNYHLQHIEPLPQSIDIDKAQFKKTNSITLPLTASVGQLHNKSRKQRAADA